MNIDKINPDFDGDCLNQSKVIYTRNYRIVVYEFMEAIRFVGISVRNTRHNKPAKSRFKRRNV